MDTKLKTVSRHRITKTVAILLLCVLFWMMAKEVRTTAEQIEERNISNVVSEAMFENEYLHSESFVSDIQWRASLICDELYEGNGRAGFIAETNEMHYYAKLGDKTISSGVDESYFTDSQCQYIMYKDGRAVKFSDRVDPRMFENYVLTYSSYNLPRQEKNIYDQNGDVVGTEWIILPETENQGEAIIYVGMSNEAVAQAEADFKLANTILKTGANNFLKMLVPSLLLLIYLCVVAGRSHRDTKLHVMLIDKLWTELTVVGLVWIPAGAIAVVGWSILEFFVWRNTGSSRVAGMVCIGLGTLLGTLLTMLFLLSFVRKCKAKMVIKSSLIGIIWIWLCSLCRGLKGLFINLFNDKPFEKYYFADVLHRRQRTFILLSLFNVIGFCAFIWIFVGIVFPIFEMYVVYKYMKANNNLYRDMGKILDQVNEIEQGNLNYNPDIERSSPLHPCSEKLLNISNGMQKSVEKQMSSERTKIDLVTNVSHDLKTPLTSIIGYIDLLQKEELNPEARDYVDVLAQKSEKLKNIVSDVFALAKSSSGNLEMSQEKLDFKILVEQNMGDMEDKIMSSGLAIRVSMPDEAVNIVADGKRLTRVLQNIMDNALSYSLAGSRIYVTLKTNGHLTVQNTAGYEMDFTAEEITERFARGDKSRSDGGSGLGLSIAQSFTAACGGEFAVNVDGDQFKVEIAFPVTRDFQEKKEEYTKIEENHSENI